MGHHFRNPLMRQKKRIIDSCRLAGGLVHDGNTSIVQSWPRASFRQLRKHIPVNVARVFAAAACSGKGMGPVGTGLAGCVNQIPELCGRKSIRQKGFGSCVSPFFGRCPATGGRCRGIAMLGSYPASWLQPNTAHENNGCRIKMMYRHDTNGIAQLFAAVCRLTPT
jgi:hypothetical protein